MKTKQTIKCDNCGREVDLTNYDYFGRGTCNRIDCFEVGNELEAKEKQRLVQEDIARDKRIKEENEYEKENRYKKQRELERQEMRGEDMPVGYLNSDEKYENQLAENNII